MTSEERPLEPPPSKMLEAARIKAGRPIFTEMEAEDLEVDPVVTTDGPPK